jgi:hypothetical protein
MLVDNVQFNPLTFLEQGKVTSGPFTGGYLNAPDGELNWYFANVGLTAFVRFIPNEILQYLNLYLANLTPASTIEDVLFPSPGTYQLRPSDSDDSYAATFLSLAAGYVTVSGNIGWFKSHIATFKSIADRNMVQNRYANGLTYPFQTEAQYDLAYLEDNCEVYRGLADFVATLNKAGSTADANYYSGKMAETLKAIQTMYSAGTRAWWFDYFPDGTHDPIGTSFYPDLVTQAFPQAYRVPVPINWEAMGYAYLNRYAPGWPTGTCPNNPGGKCDDFPWAILGYVAALRKQTAAAQQQVAYINHISTDPSQRGALTVNELGWYQRTLDVLGIQHSR